MELTPLRKPVSDPRQSLLFADDGIQANPPDGESVFALPVGDSEYLDEYIQPDAIESFEQ